MSAVWRSVSRKSVQSSGMSAKRTTGRPAAYWVRSHSGSVLQPWQRHTRLNAALHLDQRHLHVDRGRQLRLRELQLLELDDLTRLGSRRAGRAFGHAWIVQEAAGWKLAGGGATRAVIRRLAASDFTMGRLDPTTDRGDATIGAMPPRRSVLIIGSEAVPFAKTGGLADVLGALPAALARLGWDGDPDGAPIPGRDRRQSRRALSRERRRIHARRGILRSAARDGARALLVDCPDLFDCEGLYGADNVDYPDNPRRFGLLVRAALEFAARQRRRPSVVHAHDWQAGLAPVYLRTLYASHPALGGDAERVHDPQPRVSGPVPARLAASARSRVGVVRRWTGSNTGVTSAS